MQQTPATLSALVVQATQQRDREAIERIDPGLIENVIADWQAASTQRTNLGVSLGLTFQTLLWAVALIGVELSLPFTIAVAAMGAIGGLAMALPIFSKNKRTLRRLLREAGLRPALAARAQDAILASRKEAHQRSRSLPRKERATHKMRFWVEATVRAVEGPKWQRAFRSVE